MPNEPEKDYEAKLARIVQELDNQKQALRLLGLRPCSRCGKYFQMQEGKNLLDAGQLVCYRCVPDWWRQRSPTLNTQQRQGIEAKIRRWLVTHYKAKIIQQAEKLPPAGEIEFKIVVSCEQCNGTGETAGGGKCHSCDGRGNVWVVQLKPELQ